MLEVLRPLVQRRDKLRVLKNPEDVVESREIIAVPSDADTGELRGFAFHRKLASFNQIKLGLTRAALQLFGCALRPFQFTQGMSQYHAAIHQDDKCCLSARS